MSLPGISVSRHPVGGKLVCHQLPKKVGLNPPIDPPHWPGPQVATGSPIGCAMAAVGAQKRKRATISEVKLRPRDVHGAGCGQSSVFTVPFSFSGCFSGLASLPKHEPIEERILLASPLNRGVDPGCRGLVRVAAILLDAIIDILSLVDPPGNPGLLE